MGWRRAISPGLSMVFLLSLCTQNTYLHGPVQSASLNLPFTALNLRAVAVNDCVFFSPLGNHLQIIEKRRRDRINSSLSELRRLVPTAFEKQVRVCPISSRPPASATQG